MDVIITGDSDSHPDLTKYARFLVEKVAKSGKQVITGDMAGIDETVMDHCHKVGCGVAVYTRTGFPESPFFHEPDQTRESYLHMLKIMAQMSESAVVIWDGQSDAMPRLAKYMKNLGKRVHIASMQNGKMKVDEL